jgi:hypothetical protein
MQFITSLGALSAGKRRVYLDLANSLFAISSRQVNPFPMNSLVSVDYLIVQHPEFFLFFN